MRFPFQTAVSSLLTALGTRFRFDAHYFAKHSFFVLLGQVVSFLRGIVSGYLVARFFEQEIYGQYQFILSVMGMIGILAIPGMSTPVARAWSRGEGFSLPRIMRHMLLVGSLGSIILLGAIPFLEHYGKGDLWPLFLAGAILFPLPSIAMVRFGTYTIGTSRFDLMLRANVVWSLISVTLTALILLFRPSPLLMLIVATASPPLVYLWMSRKLRPPADPGGANTRGIIRYAWQLTTASLPADLSWYLDKLMISHFFGLNQLALFSVALLVPEQVKVFTKQFFPVAFAKQASLSDTRETRRKLTMAVLVGIAVYGVGIVVYVAIAPFLMPLLFPQYASPLLVLLTSVAAVTIITNPASLFTQYLEAQGKIRETRHAQWGAAGLFVVALVALIPTLGLLGAVLARGIFRVAYVGIAWLYVQFGPLQEASRSPA